MVTKEEVKSIASDILNSITEKEWKTNEKNTKKFTEYLEQLPSFEVTIESLKETKIGVALSKLKGHSNELIAGISNALLVKWKKALGISKKVKTKPDEERNTTTESASTTPIDNPKESPMNKTGSPRDEDALNKAKSHLREAYQREKQRKDARICKVIAPPTQARKRTLSTLRPSTLSRRIGNKLVVAPVYTNLSSATPKIKTFKTDTNTASNNTMNTNTNIVKPSTKRTENNTRNMSDIRKARMISPKGGNIIRVEKKPLNINQKNKSSITNQTKRVNSIYANMDKVYPDEPKDTKTNKMNGRTGNQTNGKSIRSAAVSNEIKRWLGSLVLDMSEYTLAFCEKGCTSLVLLKQFEFDDVKEVVPKLAHARLIWNSIKQLKGSSTITSTERKIVEEKKEQPKVEKRFKHEPSPRVMKKRRRSFDDAEEETFSDEDFIESDSSFTYRTGYITSLMRGKRNRRPLDDSYPDSSDMEAGYDDIQAEEERSAYIGDLEDKKEERREKRRASLKKHRKANL